MNTTAPASAGAPTTDADALTTDPKAQSDSTQPHRTTPDPSPADAVTLPSRESATERHELLTRELPNLEQHIGPIRDQAAAKRGACYEGRMTVSLFHALESLRYQQTPQEYIIEPEDDDDLYLRIRLGWQIAVMDAIYTPLHFDYLTHYEHNGRLAKTYVVIATRVACLDLDQNGRLIGHELTDVFLARSGRGGVDGMDGLGNLYKSGQTSSLSRLIAQLGPGADVTCAKPVRAKRSSDQGRPASVEPTAAAAPAGEAPSPDTASATEAPAPVERANELEVQHIKGLARHLGLSDPELANLVRIVGGVRTVEGESDDAAAELIHEKLNTREIVIPRELIPRLRDLIELVSAAQRKAREAAA